MANMASAPVVVGRAISRGWRSRLPAAIEGLWLVAVGLTPVMYTPWAAQVAKVATVRVSVGLIIMLVAVEWASSPTPRWPSVARARAWLRAHPARWVVGGALAVLGVHTLSTFLSAIWRVSIWGTTPGMDGYSLYTVAAFIVLFFVIAHRARTTVQAHRLVGVMVASGVAVATLGAGEHFGVDPFNLHIVPGPRVVSTLGNPIFAADFLLLTTLLSAGAAAAHWMADRRLGVAALWIPVLAIQMATLAFTLSRGPWVGFAAGGLAFVAALVFTSRLSLLPPLSKLFGPAVLLAVALIALPGGSDGEKDGAFAAVGGRAASILGATECECPSSLTFRLQMWDGSLRVFSQRPWFEGETDKLSVVRPLIGYGPEVFGYVISLGLASEWFVPPAPPPNYAHNHYLHLLVENGALGLGAFVGLMAAVMLLGARRLRAPWRGGHDPTQLLHAGLLAAIVGWLVASVTTIPRIADLTMLWGMLGLFVAIVATQREEPAPQVARAPRNERRAARRPRAALASSIDFGAVGVALAIVILAGWVSWVKNVDYVVASVAASAAESSLLHGDPASALEDIERALSLAPEVSYYHELRGQTYNLAAGNVGPGQQQAHLLELARLDYEAALRINPYAAREAFALAEGTLLAAETGPRFRLAEGIALLERVRDLQPNDFLIHQVLGEHRILQGMPAAALVDLETAIELAGETKHAAPSYLFKSLASWDLGLAENAAVAGERGLELDPWSPAIGAEAYRFLATVYESLGNESRAGELAIDYQRLTDELAADYRRLTDIDARDVNP